MRLIVGVVAILELATASSASASPSAHLVYSRTTDASACPDEQTLRKAVAARFGYDPFFPQAPKTVVVLVGHEQGAYTGRVELVDEQGFAHGSREITSHDDGCSELFGAVALAISIALDASLNPPAKPPAAAESQPPEPEPEPAAPMARAAVRDAPLTAAPIPAIPAESSPWAVGGELAASAGFGPSPGPRVAAFVRLRPRARLPISIAAELSVDWSLPSTASPSGAVTSELYSASLSPCWHYGAGFFCALGQVGWIQASVSEVTNPGSQGMVFAAVGARAGAEWPFSERLFVRFHGDLLYDLERPRFSSTTGDETWWNAAVTLKPVVGALGFGVGYQIP
jgi:hypothetical protein